MRPLFRRRASSPGAGDRLPRAQRPCSSPASRSATRCTRRRAAATIPRSPPPSGPSGGRCCAGRAWGRRSCGSGLVLPHYVHHLVEAGEMSGRLAEALRQAVEQMQYDQRMASEMRSALLYPAILIASGMRGGAPGLRLRHPAVLQPARRESERASAARGGGAAHRVVVQRACVWLLAGALAAAIAAAADPAGAAARRSPAHPRCARHPAGAGGLARRGGYRQVGLRDERDADQPGEPHGRARTRLARRAPLAAPGNAGTGDRRRARRRRALRRAREASGRSLPPATTCSGSASSRDSSRRCCAPSPRSTKRTARGG